MAEREELKSLLIKVKEKSEEVGLKLNIQKMKIMASGPISSVQLLSRVRLFATLWIAARQASLSITNSRNSLRLVSIESVIPSSHLILCHPLHLLPPVPISIRVFSNESVTSWQINGERMETARDFIFLGSKITTDCDCSHEIKRCLLLGRKAMKNLDSILKSRDITLQTKVHMVKAMVFPVVTYRCDS